MSYYFVLSLTISYYLILSHLLFHINWYYITKSHCNIKNVNTMYTTYIVCRIRIVYTWKVEINWIVHLGLFGISQRDDNSGMQKSFSSDVKTWVSQMETLVVYRYIKYSVTLGIR